MEALYLLALLAVVLWFNRGLLTGRRWRGARSVVGKTLGETLGATLGRKACRWRRDPTRKRAGFERWRCAACGVDGYTSTGRPPADCKRAYRSSEL